MTEDGNKTFYVVVFPRGSREGPMTQAGAEELAARYAEQGLSPYLWQPARNLPGPRYRLVRVDDLARDESPAFRPLVTG